MSYLFDGTKNQYLAQDKVVSPQGADHTYLIWISRSSAGGAQRLGAPISATRVDGAAGVENFSNENTSPILRGFRSAGGSENLTVQGATSENVWEPLLWRIDNGNDLSKVDTSQASGSRDLTVNPSCDRISLGAVRIGTTAPSDGFNGKAAHFAVWNRALVDSEKDQLFAGLNPFDIQAGLVTYVPMLDGTRDWMGFLDNLVLGGDSGSFPVLNGDNPPVNAPKGWRILTKGTDS